jgi:hypothetical protein
MIRSISSVNLFIGIITLFVLPACVRQGGGDVLVEAERFDHKGGWVTDPQFVEQMGSPYLLAHGLGVPVKDARTTLEVLMKGDYHVWVRTKNWAPGLWAAPGRFLLRVNGISSDTLGDLPQEGWGWQYAGVFPLKGHTLTLELHDLTGFEGRCDAIFLSRETVPPPAAPAALAAWREKLLGEDTLSPSVKSYDVVVVGGGIAGCAAAIAAAEQGMEVALVHDRPVPGGNASSEIRVHAEGITGPADRILRMINTDHWPNGDPRAAQDDRKRLRNLRRYKNLHLFLNWRAYDAVTVDDSITAVDARHTSTGERLRFKAPYYIDCTGDGWIGYWAGAEYMYGREEADRYGERLEKYGDLWSPEKADNRVMGSSVLWRTKEMKRPVSFPEVLWALEVAKEYRATHGTWRWEFSRDDVHQIRDAEEIRDHMLRAIYGSFYNAKQLPGNGKLALEWVSYLVGKRESRRLVGDHIFTFRDVQELRKFPDAVAVGVRPVDVHYQQCLVDSTKPDFLSDALYYRVKHYYIPYRSLYSKNICNLFMAGRCFSCSHVGLGGPRVMNTTGQMGVAVGLAASLCKKYNVNPRDIYQEHIPELKKLIADIGE